MCLYASPRLIGRREVNVELQQILGQDLAGRGRPGRSWSTGCAAANLRTSSSRSSMTCRMAGSALVEVAAALFPTASHRASRPDLVGRSPCSSGIARLELQDVAPNVVGAEQGGDDRAGPSSFAEARRTSQSEVHSFARGLLLDQPDEDVRIEPRDRTSTPVGSRVDDRTRSASAGGPFAAGSICLADKQGREQEERQRRAILIDANCSPLPIATITAVPRSPG